MESTIASSTAVATRIRDAVNALTTELVRADVAPRCVIVYVHEDRTHLTVHVSSVREYASAKALVGGGPDRDLPTASSTHGHLGHHDVAVIGPKAGPFRLERRDPDWHLTEGRDSGPYDGPDVVLFDRWDQAVTYLRSQGYDTSSLVAEPVTA